MYFFYLFSYESQDFDIYFNDILYGIKRIRLYSDLVTCTMS